MPENTDTSLHKMKHQIGEFYRFTTTRPVAILMVVIGVVVFGWISYAQLPLNLMPDISYPSLTVRTEYTGTAPEEIETTISRPVEQALGVVGNLVSISSVSKAGQSDVKLEFTWNTDMNQATSDVREKLDQVFLPDEAKRPLILRYDPSLDPIIRLGVSSGDASLFFTRYLAEEDIKRKLETIPGVAAVKVKGGLEEEIRVEMDEKKLTLIGINIQQVKNRLAQENVNLAGGNLREGQTEYLVRTLNEFKSIDEVAEVVIGTWNDKEIKIKDVGRVSRTNKEREIITRINGHESVEIEIFKEADANIVTVAHAVNQAVFGTPEQQAFVRNLKKKEEKAEQNSEPTNGHSDETNGLASNGADQVNEMVMRQMTNFIAYDLPGNMDIVKLSDQSVFIENSIDDVKTTAVVGGVLAILVLFVFLRNLTATIIVGISIPVSIVATFAPMKIFEVSLNIMSLGGLALGIGMLVDNSIVVLESIARCREEGDDLISATMRGVSEVGSAVFASTLTTIAVFFPIVFVEGVAGQIFGDMALTVVFSLLASLAVALFLIPMLYSRNTQQFAAGAQMRDVVSTKIFQFSSEEKADIAFSEDRNVSVGQRIQNGALAALSTVGLLVFKLLKVVAALVVALAKLAIMPVLLVITPVLGLLKLVRLVKFNISDRFSTFAQASEHGTRLSFVHEIWPTFLVSKALSGCYEDFRNLKLNIKNAGFVGKVIRVLCAPVVIAFILIKFVLQFFMEVAFRFAHFFMVAGAVFAKALFIELRIVFTIPTKIVYALFNIGYGFVENSYPKLLAASLNNRAMVLTSMAGLLAISILWVAPRLGSELIPEVRQGEFNVEITMPVGTPVENTDERVAEVQSFLAGKTGVGMIAAVSGTDKSANTSSEEGEHTAKLTVTVDRAAGISEDEIVADIRNEMHNYSGISWKISRPVLFSFKTPIELEIHGYNLTKLQQTVSQLEDDLTGIPGLFDVKSSMQRGNPEVQIVYNRALLAKYNLNILEVASIVRNKIRGDVATEFKEQDRKIDVLVQLREKDRESIDDLRRLVVNPNAQVPIPLEAVADIRVNEGPSEIRRVDQQRTALITANISGRDLRSVSEDIYAMMQATNMPNDFTYTLAGQNEEMETSMNSLYLALGLAIFLVYIVMASQFESIIHPFVIIFTIPLALIGVILTLFVLNIPLSIVVFLGMIMLAGIVVNNAIVLVDYINQLRARGMEKMQAIAEAGKVRLRPILMTTSTTVLGLLPMALGFGDGAEIRTPMAITVIVGLIASTVLTLVVIPTVYSLVDRKE